MNWAPTISFEEGIRQTVAWYRENQDWVTAVRSGEYLRYYESQYGSPLEREAQLA